jgi:hypothetical protein
MPAKKKNSPERNSAQVQKFAPERPEARDEGPRLLPLKGANARLAFGRAVDLADVALRKTPGKHQSAHAAKPGSREQSARSNGSRRSTHA